MTTALDPATLERALAAATEAARAAGALAMKYYTTGFEVTIKPDDTPVTQADREAEEAIVATLGRGHPLDHRSDRRHQELRAPDPGVGDAARARGAR